MGEKNKKNDNDGGKSNLTVVLKADLHCEGCVTKVLKCIRSLDGVDTASIGGEQKITVVGKVDPVKLRDKIERKTHKRIELVSPQAKKDNQNNEGGKGKENNGNSDENLKQAKQKAIIDKNSKNKSDQRKSSEKEKQLPVTTAILKVYLHCEGCIQKISKVITKTKGYQDMKIDKDKDLITVTGAMDMAALAQVLKKHLKKDVEILPSKKDANEKKEKGGGGGEKDKSKNEKGKNSGSGDKGKNATGGGGEKNEVNKVEFQVVNPNLNPNPNPYLYVYGAGIMGEQFYYNPYMYGPYHAPQLFSDENPNACRIM